MNDALGDRMKLFEDAEADRRFLPLIPVCARLDGKCFSSFTKGLNRPYDENMHNLMVECTKFMVEETNANMGYTQSDEISLTWYSDDINSQIFFDGRIQKMTSVLAAMCSVRFNHLLQSFARRLDELQVDTSDAEQYKIATWEVKATRMPIFDCRVWTVPTLMEAVNVFLWREWDCTKNSITQAASHYYSHKELHSKNGSEKQEMLFAKGINFNDYPVWFKRGTYVQRRKVVRKFTAEELDKLPPKHNARTNSDLIVERTDIEIIDMPILSKVTNRVDVFFKGEKPVSETCDV